MGDVSPKFTVISIEFSVYIVMLAFVCKVMYGVYLTNNDIRTHLDDDNYHRYENAQTFNNYPDEIIRWNGSQDSIFDL